MQGCLTDNLDMVGNDTDSEADCNDIVIVDREKQQEEVAVGADIVIVDGEKQQGEAATGIGIVIADRENQHEDVTVSVGERAPGVTAESHMRMGALLAQGAIPQTTLATRLRHKLTSKSEYGVPPQLREALALGYLHPNLPPPRGLKWKGRVGRWTLVPRGG